MNKLYTALEDCLKAIEAGQEIETILERYPEFEKELRPLLKVSLMARNSGEPVISEAVKHRGRVRLLQQANEIRFSRTKLQRQSFPTITRLAIVFSLVAVAVLTSTGFVSASSATLPGDQLYPVKRSWEGMQLFFAFNPQEHDLLESQFDQERLNEIDGLLVKKKTASIEFTGLISRQADGGWQVSGIPVSVADSTNSPSGGIPDGAPVSITGFTRSDGVVDVQALRLLQPGVQLPPFGVSEKSKDGGDGESGSHPSTAATPGLASTGSQNSTQGHKSYSFSGVVQSMDKNVWIINGQTVYTDRAASADSIKIGSMVKFDGYFGSDGKFVVTQIEIKTGDNPNKPQNNNGGSNSGSGSDGKDGSGGGGGGDSGGSDDNGH